MTSDETSVLSQCEKSKEAWKWRSYNFSNTESVSEINVLEEELKDEYDFQNIINEIDKIMKIEE
jgi:hypothetical protein